MSLSRRFRRSVPFLFAVLILAPQISNAASKTDFSRLVVMGDSLTAGFQNFSLYDRPAFDGQSFGYAAQVARQAGAELTLPLISYPGIPPAVTVDPNTGNLVRETGLGTRLNPDEQATNLSVPGFNVADAISHLAPGSPGTNPIDALAIAVLAVPGKVQGCGPIPLGPSISVVSQLACAIALHPTTVLVSIGSNDALQALTSGLPTTDTGTFAAQYAVLLTGLALTRAQIIVSNIPDVTATPFASACGLDSNGTHYVPDIVGGTFCGQPRALTAAQIAAIQSTIAAYNRTIGKLAARYHATVVDINGLFQRLAATGYALSSGQVLTIAPRGGLFSLDLIHPTDTGYAILANEVINTLNGNGNNAIPLVNVDQVAATDWLVPKLP